MLKKLKTLVQLTGVHRAADHELYICEERDLVGELKFSQEGACTTNTSVST